MREDVDGQRFDILSANSRPCGWSTTPRPSGWPSCLPIAATCSSISASQASAASRWRGHLGRTVKECVPALAGAVEDIVASIMKSGEPVLGVEVDGQIDDRSWVTYWHPLRRGSGAILGINVAAEEITERKRAESRARSQRKQTCARSEALSRTDRTTSASSSGPPTPTVRSPGITNVGTITPGRPWKTCRAGAGGRCTIRNTWTGSPSASRKVLTPVRPGKTRFRCEASQANIAGSCRGPFRSGTSGSVARWFGSNTDVTEQIEAEKALRASIERQIAIADVLKVIAGSPSDVRPVFEAICGEIKPIDRWTFNGRHPRHRR